MADTQRLNGVIAALEQDEPAFVSFCAAEIGVAQAMNAAPYDGVVFEMEHRPYDIRALRDCLQYMLDRGQILHRGTLAPAVTPFVRIPPNGGEASQWVAKQVERQHVTALLTDPQYSTGWVVSQPPALFAVEKTWVNVSVTGSQVPTSIPFQCEIQIVPATSVIPTVSFCTWLVSTLPVAGSSVWIAPLTRDGSK